MRDRTIILNEATLPNWKRPVDVLAIIDSIKAKHPAGWLTSGGKLSKAYHELWQGGLVHFGMEHIKQRQFRLHPSFEEPYDYFAANIDEQKRQADYAVVQNKSVTNFNAVGTNNFQPDLLATFVAEQIERLAEPTLTFMLRMNADAIVCPADIHAALKTALGKEQRPVWLYGFQRSQPTDCWFLQYIYPGYDESRKFDYRIGSLAPADEQEVERYMRYVEGLANNH